MSFVLRTLRPLASPRPLLALFRDGAPAEAAENVTSTIAIVMAEPGDAKPIALAPRYALPAVYPRREFVTSGPLEQASISGEANNGLVEADCSLWHTVSLSAVSSATRYSGQAARGAWR